MIHNRWQGFSSAGIAIMVSITLSHIGCNNKVDQKPFAIYKDFTLLGAPAGGELTTGLRAPPSPDIFIQLSDESIFALKDFPQDVAARDKDLELSNSADTQPGDAVFRCGHTLLEFKQGHLTYANLTTEWPRFKLGSKLSGPFYKFPLTRAQIVELFGEPLEWKRAPKPPSGP